MPSEKELEKTALAWPEQAGSVEIIDQETYDDAAELIKRIVAVRKEVVAHHKPIKDAANKAHKEAIAAEKRLLEPLQKAESLIKTKLLAWDREQERIREAERKRLEEEQRKREEEERLELAAQLEESGAPEEVVNEALDTPMPVAPIITAPKTYEKASGISTRTLYSAEVMNLRVLCAAVGAGTAPETLVQPNQVALNGLARSMKEAFKVPGCKLLKSESMTVR